MNKKFCHIVFERYPADERVRRYCNILSDKGLSVYVICIKGKGERALEKLGNQSIFRLPIKKKRSTNIRRIWEYFCFEILVFFKVTSLFLCKGVKIYHVHTLPDFLVFTTLIPKLFRAKIILDFHELFPEYMMQLNPSMTQNSKILKFLKFQERISFKFADEIITFHDPAKEILKKRISKNKSITTVMNSVDPREMKDIKKGKSKEFRLIYNGTINYNLNLSCAVEALHIIKEKFVEDYQSIILHLYGDGPDLKNVLETAKRLDIEHVIYHGRLPYNEMYAELAKASALILPPKSDIYSNLYYSGKLIESIFLKIPIIASRLNTYLFYYPENNLFYFEPGNAQKLAETIIEIYKRPELIKEKTENAFMSYQKISWPIMSNRYAKLIDKLVPIQ